MNICLETCPFNKSGVNVDSLRRETNTVIHTLNSRAKNGEKYCLSFTPVGNSPIEPTIIIVGKTPGLRTHGKFMELYRSGSDIEHSAFQSVYSEMKPALFNMLKTKTRFFDLMELVAPQYWKDRDKLSQWNAMFDDYNSSRTCGIQLTQSCNCCIHTSDSKEPSKNAYKEIQTENPNCLFSSLIITNKLKIIIFLDSPSNDSRIHPEHLFLKTKKAQQLIDQNVKITSFPHPSGASPISTLTILQDQDRLMRKYPNAYQAIERSRKVIEDCISLYCNN